MPYIIVNKGFWGNVRTLMVGFFSAHWLISPGGAWASPICEPLEISAPTVETGSSDSRFGISVGMSQGTTVTGAMFSTVGSDPFAGTAVCKYIDGSECGIFENPLINIGDRGFGAEVAANGDLIVVGMYEIWNDNWSGPAYVYRRDGPRPAPFEYVGEIDSYGDIKIADDGIIIAGGHSYDSNLNPVTLPIGGRTVDIQKDGVIAIGVDWFGNDPIAVAQRVDSNTWMIADSLLPSDWVGNDRFGRKAAVSEGWIVAGSGTTHRIYVFQPATPVGSAPWTEAQTFPTGGNQAMDIDKGILALNGGRDIYIRGCDSAEEFGLVAEIAQPHPDWGYDIQLDGGFMFVSASQGIPASPGPAATYLYDLRNSDLSVSKTALVSTVNVGESVEFEIVVENLTTRTAIDVNVHDSLPHDLEFVNIVGCDNDPNGFPVCELGNIGASGKRVITLTATPAEFGYGLVGNIVEVSSDVQDLVPANNRDISTVTILNSEVIFKDGFEILPFPD